MSQLAGAIYEKLKKLLKLHTDNNTIVKFKGMAGVDLSPGDLVAYRNEVLQTAFAEDVTTSDVVTAGTPATFESAETDLLSVAMLSATKAIVCYWDSGNPTYATACTLNISDDTITPGTPTTLALNLSEDYRAVFVGPFSEDLALLCYSTAMNSGGLLLPLTIDGDTITHSLCGFGEAALVISSPAANYFSTTKLNDSGFLMVYKESVAGLGYAARFALDSSPCFSMAGTLHSFDSDIIEIKTTGLSSDKVLACYLANTGSIGKVNLLTVGSPITSSGGVPLDAVNAVDDLVITALTSTKVLACYTLTATGHNIAVIVGIGSIPYVVSGSAVDFASSGVTGKSLTMLSSTKALLCYQDASDYGKALVLNIDDDNAITYGTPVAFESAAISGITVTALSTTKAIVCYKDASDYGKSCVLDATDDTITIWENPVGIVDQTAIAGNDVDVIIDGIVSDKFTGLVVGANYAVDIFGNLIMSDDDPRIGKAVSPTQLLLDNTDFEVKL